MSLFSPFLFGKKWNYTPKIQILTNVNTSPPQENKNIDDDDVPIKKCTLKGAFRIGSIGFAVICYYTFINKIAFLLSFFDPF